MMCLAVNTDSVGLQTLHYPLECTWGITQPKRHYFPLKKPKQRQNAVFILQIELSGSPADVIIDSSIISSVVLMVLNMFITKQNKK